MSSIMGYKQGYEYALNVVNADRVRGVFTQAHLSKYDKYGHINYYYRGHFYVDIQYGSSPTHPWHPGMYYLYGEVVRPRHSVVACLHAEIYVSKVNLLLFLQKWRALVDDVFSINMDFNDRMLISVKIQEFRMKLRAFTDDIGCPVWNEKMEY